MEKQKEKASEKNSLLLKPFFAVNILQVFIIDCI